MLSRGLVETWGEKKRVGLADPCFVGEAPSLSVGSDRAVNFWQRSLTKRGAPLAPCNGTIILALPECILCYKL